MTPHPLHRAARALTLVLVTCLAGALGACGDDGSTPPPDPMPDPDPIPVPVATYTKFVLDVVQNQTMDTTAPIEFARFSTLEDPDGTNPAAYASLF